MRLSLIIFGFTILTGIPFGMVEGKTISECDKEEKIKEAQGLLSSNPLQAIEILSEIKDCDDKFGLLYLAEDQIAKNSRGGFYYQGKVYPRGWHDQNPNVYEQYIMENTDHFYPASEGGNQISSNKQWLDKILNPKHEVFGNFELKMIEGHDSIPLEKTYGFGPKFDPFLWTDNESPYGAEQVLKLYREWLKKWSNHQKLLLVTKRIGEIEEFLVKLKNFNF